MTVKVAFTRFFHRGRVLMFSKSCPSFQNTHFLETLSTQSVRKAFSFHLKTSC